MKRKNKRQVAKEKVWFRLLKKRHKDNWEEVFDSIQNKHLRIQVACLIFWDCYEENVDEDWSVHKSLMNQYCFETTDKSYTRDELIDALHSVGYPLKLAVLRSRPPNVYRD